MGGRARNHFRPQRLAGANANVGLSILMGSVISVFTDLKVQKMSALSAQKLSALFPPDEPLSYFLYFR
jgi:hypothetical protein